VRLDGQWEGELLNTRKDGTIVSVASRWSTHLDEHGRQIGTLETNNDITERKQAEEALRRSQGAYLAEAQRLSLTGSFGWDVASGDVFWSAQSFSIFEYEKGIKPSIDLMIQRVHPEDLSRVRRAFERASKEAVDFDIEYRLLIPGDTIKHIHAVARAMLQEPAKRQFVGALMDVTAAKRAEEQLHEVQAELAYVGRVTSLGALSASIAHEVSQPLAAIVARGAACLRWLNRGDLGEMTDAVKSIISDGHRAGEIVQRIRTLSRKAELIKTELNMNEVIEEVIPLVRLEITGHRANLRLDLASPLPPVLGDRVQLQQVIINLIMNGIQAMASIADRPRELVVRSEWAKPDHVLVAIQDSGIGINSQDAEQLFHAFFTTKPQGMGMGLSICRSILEAHGGQVWAAANSSGPGAIVRFSMPSVRQSNP
jgi:C4-dicarboxylate-specific signal transduction histidine kinase